MIKAFNSINELWADKQTADGLSILCDTMADKYPDINTSTVKNVVGRVIYSLQNETDEHFVYRSICNELEMARMGITSGIISNANSN